MNTESECELIDGGGGWGEGRRKSIADLGNQCERTQMRGLCVCLHM